MRVVLLGPPGAGKGTQARLVEERLRISRISTGDILRRAVSDQSALGKRVAGYIEKGLLVPDALMLELMTQRLSQEDCVSGFVLDGFPRSSPQAVALEAMLRNLGFQLERVLFICVTRDTIIQRVTARRTCRGCGGHYHLAFDPPSQEGVCDRCHGELYQRPDDREETIAARLDVYETQTAPLMDYYRRRGLLQEIDGMGDVKEVKGRVFQALGLVGA
ncbi:MAG: adenylate kinase [Candidatus Binatia bacterium]